MLAVSEPCLAKLTLHFCVGSPRTNRCRLLQTGGYATAYMDHTLYLHPSSARILVDLERTSRDIMDNPNPWTYARTTLRAAHNNLISTLTLPSDVTTIIYIPNLTIHIYTRSKITCGGRGSLAARDVALLGRNRDVVLRHLPACKFKFATEKYFPPRERRIR